jgi:hypothetical protein
MLPHRVESSNMLPHGPGPHLGGRRGRSSNMMFMLTRRGRRRPGKPGIRQIGGRIIHRNSWLQTVGKTVSQTLMHTLYHVPSRGDKHVCNAAA